MVAGDRVLGAVGLASLGIVLGLGMTMVATVPLVENLGGGASAYGATIAAWGAGSMAGALAARRLTAGTETVAFLAGCGLVAVMTIGAGVSPTLPWVAGALVLMGVGDGIAAVATAGILQRRTPDRVRSRVVAALAAAMNLGLAVSYLTAALVAGPLGPRTTYVLGGAVAGAALPFAATRLAHRKNLDPRGMVRRRRRRPTRVGPRARGG
jgi:MFS family permease